MWYSFFGGEFMYIEFKTTYTDFENEILSELFVKYGDSAQTKKMKNSLVVIVVCSVFAMLSAVLTHNDILVVGIVLWLLFYIGYHFYVMKKALPNVMKKANKVICPSAITLGFYDEYFYEKAENNMQVSEASIRYEFVNKCIETKEYFIIGTKNHRVILVPKRDVPPEKLIELSTFFKRRIPHIYKYIDK
jgi:hypothetical protein